MIKFKRLTIALLALLCVSATAWAQETITVTWTFADLQADAESTTFTKDGVTIQCDTRLSSGKSFNSPVTISTTLGNFTKIEITGGSNAPIQNDNFTNVGNVSTWTGNTASLTLPDAIAYANQFVFTIVPTGPEVTITGTSAEGQQATFEMPQYDVTATYTIKRDISVDVTATMGDGTDGVRYRVKKDGNKFIPAEMEMAAVPALFTVNDAIEQKALTQTQDYIVQIYAIDAEGQPTGNPMTFANFTFEPGIYAVKAVAADGSDYDGETALSNKFQLFEGYDLTVKPANDFSKGKVESVTVGTGSVTIDANTGEATKTDIAPETEVKIKAKRGYVIDKVEVKKTVQN